jgi:tRNA A37 N6-isopentenylltransferase MiaA
MDIKKIKQKTRHYAKRQITWIKHHYENPLIFNQTNENAIITKVKSWLNQ